MLWATPSASNPAILSIVDTNDLPNGRRPSFSTDITANETGNLIFNGTNTISNEQLGVGTVSIDKMAITEFPTVVWKTSYTDTEVGPANAGEWHLFKNTSLNDSADDGDDWVDMKGIRLFDTDFEGRNISALISALESGSYIRVVQAGVETAATAIVVGNNYTILTEGTTDFTTIGAVDSLPGTTFTANAVGTGSGTATLNRFGVYKISEKPTVSTGSRFIIFASLFQSSSTYSDAPASIDFQVKTDAIIDGNLIVTGTIEAAAINANSGTFGKLAAAEAFIGDLTVDFLSASTVVADTVWATKINAGALNANLIESNSIDTLQLKADAVKATNIDVDGAITIDADTGAFLFGKTSGDDVNTEGVFIGNESGEPRMVFGSASSYIYYEQSTQTVHVVGASFSGSANLVPTEYTTPGMFRFDFTPTISTVNIELAGGGGGGGNQSNANNIIAGSSGGASMVQIFQSDGTLRQTITASGGTATTNGGFGGQDGEDGEDFGGPGNNVVPSTANSLFVGTGGQGGQGSLGNGSGASGVGAGGGGAARAGAAGSAGQGGERGSYSTVDNHSYDVIASTDYMEVTVGAAGVGFSTQFDNRGGNGAPGAVRVEVL